MVIPKLGDEETINAMTNFKAVLEAAGVETDEPLKVAFGSYMNVSLISY